MLVAVSVMAAVAAAEVAAAPPKERDFFGAVVSVEGGVLVVSTEAGIVEVPTSQDTSVRLPLKRDASPADLSEGDVVALSLDERNGELVADKIVLIPGKTQHRHMPGKITAVSETQITIQPIARDREPVTFTRAPTTKVKFHKGTKELFEGAFVVIVADRDVTGELSRTAREINVTLGRPRVRPEPAGAEAVRPEPRNRAEVRGVLEGVDEDGNLIVNGTTVTVDAETAIESGLVVGQVVEIEAELSADGLLLAREVEAKEEDRGVSRTTRLDGLFEGVDDQGNWTISGTPVAVTPETDTDGIPYLGQRVKVKAFYEEDGSILAREIENESGRGRFERGGREVKLEGTFQGLDADGNWIINGAAVSVDSLTRLDGAPAVGARVKVKAVLREDGTLVAREVKGQRGRLRQPRSDAEIRGTVKDILEDGTLIVNGVAIAVSVLTEFDGDVRVGDYVEVEALIQEGGTLLAREVESKGEVEAGDLLEPSKVEIEGTIDRVNEDGTLIVSGITVVVSPLSEIKGDLIEGTSVKIEGVLRPDGSLLVAELKGEGRRPTASRTEVKIEGTIESVNRDEAGVILSVVVDGVTIAVTALTEVEGLLEPGAAVKIKAIISEGELMASKIQGRANEELPEAAEVKIEGFIEALQRNDQGRIVGVIVNGLEVGIDALAGIEGELEVGREVEIDGIITEGTIVARKVESEEVEKKRSERSEFELEGLVESINRDEDGSVVGVVVQGLTVAVGTLTRIKGTLEVGSTVEIEGMVVGENLLAKEIDVDERAGGEEAKGGDKGDGEARGVKIEGLIGAVQRDEGGRVVSVTVEGVQVAIDERTEVEGRLEVGGRVRIEATVVGGVLTAEEVEARSLDGEAKAEDEAKDEGKDRDRDKKKKGGGY